MPRPSSRLASSAASPVQRRRSSGRRSCPPSRYRDSVSPPPARKPTTSPRARPSVTPSKARRSVTPSRTTRAATPSRTKRATTPSVTPSKLTHTATPSRAKRATTPSGTPSKARHSVPPSRAKRATTPSVTPSKLTRAGSPPRSRRSVTPSRARRSVTPSRARRSVTPSRGRQSVTPSRITRAVTPSRARRSVTPSRARRSTTPSRPTRTATPSRTRDPTTPSRSGRSTRDPSPPGTPSRKTRALASAAGTPSSRRRVTGSSSPPPAPRGAGRWKGTSIVAASPIKPKGPPPPIVYDPLDVDQTPASLSGDDCASAALFTPVHFLRCHSSRGDPADVRTELWDCKFMPGGGGNGLGDVVATSGGNSVCLLHVQTGTLLKKFSHPDITERLGALAWSRLQLDAGGLRRIAVLAVGGARRVYLLHPDNLTWYASFSVGGSKCREVTALAFHPRRSRWLLVATGDGGVSLWDVGVPAPPLYGVTPRQLLQLETGTPPLALALHADTEMLLVGCEGGLSGWRLTLEVVKGEKKPREVRYDLPPPPPEGNSDEGEFVDSVTVLGGRSLAVKCVERGCVYIWPMTELLPQKEGKLTRSRVDLGSAPHRVLRWSDTDASYLGLGAGASLLAAGDDEGAIWIWNWRDSGAASGEPVNTLRWPRPEDDALARVRKVPLHRFPILVNRVCISEDERCLVAVTHNNMVCIWRRAGEAASDAEDMEVE